MSPIRIIFPLVLLIQILFSQSKVGTASAPFLGISIGPSSVGMGGAITSHPIDASVLYVNPGAISRLAQSQILIAKTDWIVGTHINFISTVIQIDPSRSLGFYINHLDYGEEEITDLDNQEGTGLYWSASDIVTGGAYAQNLTDQFSLGGTLKYIHQRIHNESANTMAVDIGILYKTSTEKFNIGMSVSNWGSDMSMDGKDLYRKIDIDPNHDGHNETLVAKLKTDEWPLPLFFRVGFSGNLISTPLFKFTVATDAMIPSDDIETLQIGFESSYMNRLFLRGGYKNIGNHKSIEGFTGGAGVRIFTSGMSLGIDYSIQDFGYFGLISHLGISIEF
ncbi:MAG: PorV/PorQ family protein [Candidatus Marinimicrobia bacterium]|jgi:hypothetical protein|nr:PorV/PorQ family protein [Candidatus Neomarinimicrobiota bacterium]MBT6712218.1 PorV/PorQ family protein [Candidatus Neomarinimicrobiota bacterium]